MDARLWWMTAVRVKSLWLLLMVPKVGGIIVDQIGQEPADSPAARLVEAIPVARAMSGLGSGCPSEGGSRVDETCAASATARIPRYISWFRAQIAVTTGMACRRLAEHAKPLQLLREVGVLRDHGRIGMT
jgi:hypothetical protein